MKILIEVEELKELILTLLAVIDPERVVDIDYGKVPMKKFVDDLINHSIGLGGDEESEIELLPVTDLLDTVGKTVGQQLKSNPMLCNKVKRVSIMTLSGTLMLHL